MFYQVQGIVKIQKQFLGLKWATFEAFYDSQLLGWMAAKIRLDELKLSFLKEKTHEERREWLEEMDLPANILDFDTLSMCPVVDGSFVDFKTQIRFEPVKVYPHRF